MVFLLDILRMYFYVHLSSEAPQHFIWTYLTNFVNFCVSGTYLQHGWQRGPRKHLTPLSNRQTKKLGRTGRKQTDPQRNLRSSHKHERQTTQDETNTVT